MEFGHLLALLVPEGKGKIECLWYRIEASARKNLAYCMPVEGRQKVPEGKGKIECLYARLQEGQSKVVDLLFLELSSP